MIEKVPTVWLDGRLVAWDDANVHVLTHTLHYGFGAFEGIRAYGQTGGGAAVFRLGEHVDRLFASAATASIEVPFDRAALAAACLEVVRANRLADAYLRPLVFAGDPVITFAHWQNRVRVAVVAFPWGGFADQSRDDGTTAKISPYLRPKAHARLFKAKLCGHYVASVLAYGDAARSGVREAIFLDEDGVVCEATGENLFIVREGVLLTPPADRAILLGITRDSVITLARDLGYEVLERSFGADELVRADEAFTTGTAAEIVPIREIDGRPIGEGRPGPVTRAVQAAFVRAARGPDDHRGWLTRV